MEATRVRPEQESSRIPVSVVEGHPLYRDALTRLFEEAGDMDVDVVAGSVGKFVACRPRRDGIVVLDLTLPGVNGSAAVLQINGMGNRVLVVSGEAAKSDVLGAISAGARGFLSKECEGTEILRAVREIAAGNSYVSPTLASIVLTTEQNRQAGRAWSCPGRRSRCCGWSPPASGTGTSRWRWASACGPYGPTWTGSAKRSARAAGPT